MARRATRAAKSNELRQLGGAIRAARRQQALSQAELARRVGVSQELVSQVERGVTANRAVYIACQAILNLPIERSIA